MKLFWIGLIFGFVGLTSTFDWSLYKIGVGIGDVTGPAAHINMMGYAKLAQTTSGIHTRLFSRAFVIGIASQRIAFVSVDVGMISQLVKQEVIQQLKHQFGNSMYTDENVCISGTHTHSGPGGYFQYALYDIPSFGYVKETADAMVRGIVKSIVDAHESIQNGYIYVARGNLSDSSINRSPYAYVENPEEERLRYATNVDTEMLLLKFTDLKNKPLGIINWFPVHGTSMNSTNTLISSDNKGYASLLFEKQMNGRSILPGKGKFIAAFAQSNEGDVSPNTAGPHCRNTGEACDGKDTSCNGQYHECIATGPGRDMFESTKIIGRRQFLKAWELFKSARVRLSGLVKFNHKYVNMSQLTFYTQNGTMLRTCVPALGHSFAAGTTDGPGEFNFKRYTKSGSESRAWSFLRDRIKAPSPETKSCHFPKPILVSQIKRSFHLLPEIIPVQLLQVGEVFIAGLPGEFTTMAGRRIREVIKETFRKQCVPPCNVLVALAGLSNTYTSYITTVEEYQAQGYEGASTLYGPHTHDAYIELFRSLTAHMMKDEPVVSNVKPPILTSILVNFLPPVLFDISPRGFKFGNLVQDVNSSYTRGDTVQVKFVSGDPRNNVQMESFLYVDLFSHDTWLPIASDASWETKFLWSVKRKFIGKQSEATISWEIPPDAALGTYRIRFQTFAKRLLGEARPYNGTTSNFAVESYDL